MIHLSQAPIFLKFLQKYFRLSQSKYYHGNFSDHFYIAGKCNCNQKDCGTVLLKRRSSCSTKSIIEIEDKMCSSKGFIFVNDYLGDGYVEIECIAHKFPFKFEINKLFPKNGKLGNHRFSKKLTHKKIGAQDEIKLKRYFNPKMSQYEKRFFDGLDKDATTNMKLFQYVR